MGMDKVNDDIVIDVPEASGQGNEPVSASNDRSGSKSFKRKLIDFYDKKYKLLLIIPIILLVLSLLQIGYQYSTTGDIMIKGVSLKGGVSIRIPLQEQVNLKQIEDALKEQFPKNDIAIRSFEKSGEFAGITIDADIDGTNNELFESFIGVVKKNITEDIGDNYVVNIIGSSFGASFLREAFIIFIISFLCMAIVVFIYFRKFAPSIAVILAAFSDIVGTLAVANLLGVKLSSGGIAAFIMLIGYSVDTDILLSTRVLMRKEGTVMDRILSSIETGMMMTLTALVAVIIALIFSQSEALSQIMLIVMIGLLFDIVNTWIQNVGILRLYLERKQRRKTDES